MCVLVVDDDELVRESIVEGLASAGLSTVVASDGAEAAKLIDDPPRKFSVLLTDFHMPGGLTGSGIAALMKARHPHVHLFVMTGRPEDARLHIPATLSVTILEKPISLKTLTRHIAHLVVN